MTDDAVAMHVNTRDEAGVVQPLDAAAGAALIQADAKIAEAFSDDSEISPGTVEAIGGDAPNLSINIGRRLGGRWAALWLAQIGKRTIERAWTGNHPTREAAIVAAADAVDDFLPKSIKGITRAELKQAQAIRRALEEIDLAVKAATGKTIEQIRGEE